MGYFQNKTGNNKKYFKREESLFQTMFLAIKSYFKKQIQHF